MKRRAENNVPQAKQSSLAHSLPTRNFIFIVFSPPEILLNYIHVIMSLQFMSSPPPPSGFSRAAPTPPPVPVASSPAPQSPALPVLLAVQRLRPSAYSWAAVS
ncbi:hypothetical protein BC937DRAFT_88833 [Endogone sp. FLAS-F59071]|nr:hypothetical protein BC937DRAFT_88833 [Endogone sp. FLAS-F59071]|eukprot:RUS18373.1 hypothetical protein BC937DRAFT_88833 [Endogone sp. FLAS-F59071]